MGKHVVCRVDEIDIKMGKLVHVEGRDIAVFNLGDRFAAVSNKCPHEGADLCAGKVFGFPEADGPGCYRVSDRLMVRCPWHGWEFDLETGRSYVDPNRVRVKPFDVSVSDGAGLAEGPYQVETFEVETDGKYVIVEV
ncbi:Rieske (2Fe-2S) protein [Pseudoruegeria sp. HB172150]|uniref:Rieske (2Fe-2S) protein n=1 Tax=Pseudoruegeria sp. HB172150 TaxID=2721164 RepID=UPI00155218B8|nr:Rieske (2Fe-2S) protein [Pseudoruegeria sp. HB172150]